MPLWYFEAGDELLSITGKPYDTLEEVIGIRGKDGAGSLKDYGVTYTQVELNNGLIDDQAVIRAINKNKAGFIQRSRGYAWRPALTVSEIESC